MRRRSLSLGLLAALVCVVLPAGGAAAAKMRTEAASSLILVEVPRSQSRPIFIGAVAGKEFPKPSVGVDEQGRAGVTVSYSVHGRVGTDGRLVARLPGVGRIDLRFKATHSEPFDNSTDPHCRSDGHTILREGVFSGTIDLRGGSDLPSVERRSAPGKIFETPAQTCPAEPHKDGGKDAEGDLGESDESGSSDSLQVGARLKGGLLHFTATPAPRLRPDEPAKAIFEVSWFRSAHGLTTSVSDLRSAPAGDLVFSPSTVPPTEATLTPPSPFQGSGAFKLESPTVASWTGDLRIDLPILGEVSLTGSQIGSTLCQGTTCTDTLPPGVNFGVTVFR